MGLWLPCRVQGRKKKQAGSNAVIVGFSETGLQSLHLQNVISIMSPAHACVPWD